LSEVDYPFFMKLSPFFLASHLQIVLIF